jgi:phage/plasmid primase-like uncharacterized protein
MLTASRLDAFRQIIEQAGLVPPSLIPPGKLIRFPGIGKSNGNTSGWAWLSEDGLGGAYGDWASGLSDTWHAQHDYAMTATERAAHMRRVAELRCIRQEEDAKQHAEAAQRAQVIWDAATPVTASHSYLTKKQVQPHGLRVDTDNRLIVPVMIDGTIASLQTIDDAGEKRYLRGGKKCGGSFTLGNLSEANTILICEGYATGASLYETSSFPVVVAFDAGNLMPIAEGLRQQYPTAMILVCGDNDVHADGKPNTGLLAATAAASAIKGVLVMPELNGMKCDWNDVHVQCGLDAVREKVSAAIQREDTTTTRSGRVMDEIYTFLGRFVAYPSDHARVAHCLWAAHTHLMDKWESTPRLAFLSPEPGSGKTRALELTETLVPRPVEAINASPAYMFRKISDPEGMPTILYDEIDTIFGPRAKEHEELRGVINAGHRRGASAGRCVIRGKTVETEELPAFCAIAMAGLGNLPDTILSRSIIARMRKRKPTEHVEPYRRKVHGKEGYLLRDRLAVWARQVSARLDTNPSMPDGIEDRNADVWESLLSVADAAGGDWPERARVAAVALVAANRGNQLSLGVRLLTDLYSFFLKQSGDAWTEDILTALHQLEEAPWGDLKGKPLDARKLASLLLPYGVKSDQVKIGGVNHRGYKRADLQDAWARYLPVKEEEGRNLDPSPQISATSATHATDNLFTEVEL